MGQTVQQSRPGTARGLRGLHSRGWLARRLRGRELGALCALIRRRLVADSECSSLINFLGYQSDNQIHEANKAICMHSFICTFVHSFLPAAPLGFTAILWHWAGATPEESCSPRLVSGALGPASYPCDPLLASAPPWQLCASVPPGTPAQGFSVSSTADWHKLLEAASILMWQNMNEYALGQKMEGQYFLLAVLLLGGSPAGGAPRVLNITSWMLPPWGVPSLPALLSPTPTCSPESFPKVSCEGVSSCSLGRPG